MSESKKALRRIFSSTDKDTKDITLILGEKKLNEKLF